jgi:molybdopterin-synthase adenylyltransferase
MLSDEALRRYARHIVLPEIGGTGQARLLAGSVLIVGMGGLGAPLALYLAAAGVGRLGLVDDDRVEISNLHRQVIFSEADVGRLKVEAAADRLTALAGGVRLEPHALRLDASGADALIGGYDIVADGTDNVATRRLVHDAAMRSGARWSRARCRVSTASSPSTAPSPGRPTLASIASSARSADAESLPSCAQAGVLGPAAGLVGSLMAIEVIKLLAGLGGRAFRDPAACRYAGTGDRAAALFPPPACAGACARDVGW